MQSRFLDALVRHSKTTLLQDAIKCQTVLIRRNIFLLLNQVFLFYDIKRPKLNYGLASPYFDKDL